MLTIIICSIKPTLAATLNKNIADTIGDIEYEFCCINNQNTGKGICQVYNEAAKKAKGDILCFVHEDVAFRTNEWGNLIQQIFEEVENPGVIGVAGSTLISKTPAGWYNFYLKDENRFYLYQRGVDNNPEATFLNINPKNEKLSRVVAVDGVLMFVKKEVWKEFRFDNINFKEFHYYDIDFSVRVAEKYNNYILYSMLIEHLSFGNINKSWAQNALIFDRLWKSKLPIFINRIDKTSLLKEEKSKLIFLISNLIKYKFPFTQKIRIIGRFLKISPLLVFKYFIKIFIK